MLILFQLYWSFCQIGFTSFGGLSMIPLINSEMTAHSWMSLAEVSDIVAVAEMTPGPLGLNCATFAGLRVAGLAGALVANLGILTPTFTVCAVAALFFERFKKSSVMAHIMLGVRPACIGIILTVLLTLGRQNYFVGGALAPKPILIGVVGFLLLRYANRSVPLVIAISAALGLLLP